MQTVSRFLRLGMAFSALALFSGCDLNFNGTVTVSPPQIQIQPSSSSGTLSCSAVLGVASPVVSGNAIPVNVTASGGTGPYFIAGSTSSFASTTSISRTYTDSGSQNLTLSDSVEIEDSSGASASCSLTVTVAPVTGGSSLACTVVPERSTPHIGDSFPIVVTATGGTSPYNFVSLQAGTNAVPSGSLTQISSTQAALQVSYDAAGAQTATATVKDATGAKVTCSSSLQVFSTAALQVAATPSGLVSAGQTITLTATPESFSATPSYTFTASDSHVSVQANGAVATVSSVNGWAGNFTVLVTASSAQGESVSVTVSLGFTADENLTCQLTHAAGTYAVGSTVDFSLTSSTGEALQVIQFNPGSGGAANGLSATYSTAGTKTPTVIAKSASSGVYCNGGNSVQDSVVIGSQLSCSVGVSANPVSAGQQFYAWAIIPAGVAVGNVQIISLTAEATGFSYYWPNPSVAPLISFSTSGQFPITLTIQDSSGQTASCSTTEVVQ